MPSAMPLPSAALHSIIRRGRDCGLHGCSMITSQSQKGGQSRCARCADELADLRARTAIYIYLY